MKYVLRSIASVTRLLAVLLLCSSCVGYHGTRTNGPTIQQTDNLVYLDHGLTSWVPCEKINAEQLPGGRMRVYARFANEHNKSVECQIDVKFKSADGRVVDETGWMPFLLSRRETTQFEYTSLVTGAKDFTVLLREAKR